MRVKPLKRLPWLGLLAAYMVACGPVQGQAPPLTPSPTVTTAPASNAPATPHVPADTPTPPPTGASGLSPDEAIAVVQSFIRGEAQTPQARLEAGRIYEYKWQATLKGDGIWAVKGTGNWALFEKSKVVQPADEEATRFLRGLAMVDLPPPPATPVPKPPVTASPSPPSSRPSPIPAPIPTFPPTPAQSPKPSSSELITSLRPTVVRILTNKGMGTGVIIDWAGYILTNSHVIEGATSVKVVVEDRWTEAAQVIGRDELVDLALLKILRGNLYVAILGDSDKVKAGDDIIAVGYPLDLPGAATVSRGIVSAVRPMDTPGNVRLQTDTALNPGNSGGPLFNSDGEVVGISVSRIEEKGGRIIEGMNFALAINTAKSLLPQLKAGKSVARAAPSVTPASAARPPSPATAAPEKTIPFPKETRYVSQKYWYSVVYPSGWRHEEKTPERVVISESVSSATVSITVGPHNRAQYPDFDTYNRLARPTLGEGQSALTTEGETKVWAGKPVEAYEYWLSYDYGGKRWKKKIRNFVVGDIQFTVAAEAPLADWPKLEPAIGRVMDSLKADRYISTDHFYSLSTPQDWNVDASNPDNVKAWQPGGKLSLRVEVVPGSKYDILQLTVTPPEGSTNAAITPKQTMRQREKVSGYRVDFSYTTKSGADIRGRTTILQAKNKLFWLFISAWEKDWSQWESTVIAIEERFNVAP